MGFEDEAEQSIARPYRQSAVGPSDQTNSPRPSSREGHHSTAWWNSSVLLSIAFYSKWQTIHCSDRLGVLEAGGYVDGSAIGQRHHRANTGDRHQAPSHVPHDDQQTAVQDADLLTQHPPDNEHRFDQHGEVGGILDQLLDPLLELTVPTIPTLRPKLRKVPRRSFSIAMAFDCSSLRCVSSIRSLLWSVFTCTGR
jgi:hypothetical protein